MAVTTAEDNKLWDSWLTERSHDACEELIRRYMPLVHYHVQRISVGLPKSVQTNDLISHGLLGLYDALEKFNPDRDLKFDTYASFRVRGSIIDGLRKDDWLPRTMREKIKRVEATTEKLEQQRGRFVTSEEIADELNMKSLEVEQIMNEYYTASFLSMDEKSQDSKRQQSLAETIEDKQTKTPEDQTLQTMIKQELVIVIKQLTEKEQLIISLFYFEEMTLTEIGEILSLSTSRVSQIHSKCLFKLQQRLKKDNINLYG